MPLFAHTSRAPEAIARCVLAALEHLAESGVHPVQSGAAVPNAAPAYPDDPGRTA
jgi:hypothetical protein